MKAIACSILVLLLSSCGAAYRSLEKEADFQALAELVERGTYQFQIQSATPTGGRTVQITSAYSLKVQANRFEAYLPSYDRAYQPAYAGNSPIRFGGKPENLEILRKEKKGRMSVSFTMKEAQDSYQITLEVGRSRYGTLRVSSQDRQSISYYGLLEEISSDR